MRFVLEPDLVWWGLVRATRVWCCGAEELVTVVGLVTARKNRLLSRGDSHGCNSGLLMQKLFTLSDASFLFDERRSSRLGAGNVVRF